MSLETHRSPPGALDATVVFWAAFAAAFGVLYVVVMELNLAAFTYHPRLVEFALGVEPRKSGPAMYWYGWLTTAACGGLLAGLLAMLAARRIGAAKLWLALGWLAPAGAMLTVIYFMSAFFRV